MTRKRTDGPFVLPIRDIARQPGQMREFSLTVPAPEKWGEGLLSVAADDPVDVQVRLESVHEGILVSAEIQATASGVCGRCLTDITQPVEVEFQELFGYSGDEAIDFEVQDDHVDLETPVRDAIVLSLPFQPVCQPDCPGLDPVSGEKLAPGTVLEHPIDERWAALKAYTSDHDADASRGVADNTEKS